MADEKKVVDPVLAEFYEAMEKTNAEKFQMRCWLEYPKTPAIVKVSM
jgi:hypothetical protein